MTLQHQTFGPRRLAAPKRVPFVLPGRRTLSEHLPAELIEVPITVARRSRYLRKAIVQQALDDPTNRQIRLPDVDSMGFRMYVEWLESGRVEYHTRKSSNSKDGLILRDSFDLIFAHIAGSQLEEPDFQDYIIDTLARLLDPSQTPDLKVLEVVFLEKGASNILKQFVVDKMFAVERKMLGLMRGVVDDSGIAVGCEYHVQKAGACYKDGVKNEFANETCTTNQRHNTYNSSTDSLHSGNRQPLQCLSRTSPLMTFDTTLFSMPESTYFGSTEWSREVHSPQRSVPTPSLHTDKPLPTIPPLTPGTSPSPSLSPLYPQCIDPHHNGTKAISTQELVQECLERLRRTDNSSTRTSASPDLDPSAIPVLVLECLERFKKASPENVSTSSSGSSPQNESLSPHIPILFQGQSTTTPDSDLGTISTSQQQLRRDRSFDSLPKLPLFRTPTEPQIPLKKYHLCLDSAQPLSVQPSRTPTVARKPVPLRGEDWLKQYDSVNTMMESTQIVMAKRSKKSRFKEMLRSDSRMSKFELDGRAIEDQEVLPSAQ